MKKVILMFTLLLTVSFAFATNEVNNTTTFDFVEALEIEDSNFKVEHDNSAVLYRYRYCHYRAGIKYCGAWIYVVELDEVVLP